IESNVQFLKTTEASFFAVPPSPEELDPPHPDKPNRPPVKPSRVLYISNIGASVSEKEFKTLCRARKFCQDAFLAFPPGSQREAQYSGELEGDDASPSTIPHRRNAGWGLATFSTIRAAKYAKKHLQGKLCGGQPITVEFKLAKPPEAVVFTNVLFVKGLWGLTGADEVRKAFEGFEGFKDVTTCKSPVALLFSLS
ncbi:hypothetical protein FRB90_010726, partial [Tulasnella sp. 427]